MIIRNRKKTLETHKRLPFRSLVEYLFIRYEEQLGDEPQPILLDGEVVKHDHDVSGQLQFSLLWQLIIDCLILLNFFIKLIEKVWLKGR